MFRSLVSRASRVSVLAAKPSTFVRYSSTIKFTPDHEWLSIKGDVGVFGITDYAQKALGDVVYIEVPTVGDVVKKHDQVGAVESVKAASDIYAPVSGTILKVNDQLESEPSLINSSATKDGWIAEIKLSNLEEIKELLGQEEYNKLIE